MRLHFTNIEIEGAVEVQTPSGSRLSFYDNSDGSYTPYAGVTADLAQIGSTYVITGFNQKVYTFDDQGLLLEQADPFGNVITFTHNANDQLTRAGQGDRFLTYTYDGNGRLTAVSDNLNRTVQLGYDANGDLTTVTDTLGLVTTYEYSGTTHLLTKVTDPSGAVLEETAYDSEGRAVQQWDGAGNLLVEIDYSLANSRVVTENGVVMTYTYDARNTLVSTAYACVDGTAGCQSSSNVGYDGNFKQNDVTDLNGNAITLAWNDGGSNLEYVQDALGNETFLAYDPYNNLTQTTDARNNNTTYEYGDPTFPTFLTRMTDALGNTTLYTPTTGADGVPGLLKAQQDPNGVVTTYAYNDFGQVIETVRAAGTSDAVTTTHGYDAVGRLTTTTQTSAAESRTTLNVYDAGDRLLATIANWDGVLHWQNCAFDGNARDENVCTLYGYDEAGRTISTTNALGQTNLTFYDAAGRSFLSVSNYDGSPFNAADPAAGLCNFANPDPEHNLCFLTEYDAFGRVFRSSDSLGRQSVTEYDSLGRVSRSVSNWQDGVFDSDYPDEDIETRYGYDAVGNTILVTDTLGRMTRTFYDALNRTEGVIVNWDGSAALTDCDSLPAIRDHNICTRYQYDEVGNTILVTDTLGRMTRTFYDALNRVEASVTHWNPATLSAPGDCILSPDNENTENICTLYGYDAAGNQVTTTNALNQTALTVYDSANRPFITVQNWDGVTTIAEESHCQFPPAQPDANVCAVTTYDALGRRSASKDALGNLTEFAYDGLGRLITTTRYLDQLPNYTITQYDALGNRLTQTDAEGNDTAFVYDDLNRLQTTTSAQGVTGSQSYNAAGWVLQTVDGLNHATTFSYDDLGRRLTVTDAENNTTTHEYDALGNQTALIDAESVRTTYEYDDLNRLVGVVENDTGGAVTNDSNVLTQYVYDALGNRIQIINALGFTNTTTVYDALNRPTIVEDALGNQTQTQYNALGYRTVMTDGNGAVTTYAYDGLNRLIEVSYLADGETVQYSYDALGNRTVMTDSLGTTSYDYDDLYRLVEVTDPFTATVGYGYDKVGNRTNLIYPDQRVVTYTYDMDNRLAQVLDWDSGVTSYQYDLAGRLITTTLPNGVVSVNTYDDANRLTNLEHTAASGALIARYEYQLDGVGNRTTVTETIRQPAATAAVGAFLEENGLLVMEAENGNFTPGANHDWITQTAQTAYAGDGYLRALPDVGQLYETSDVAGSPRADYPAHFNTPGAYNVWARGMAPAAGGDSLHVGLDGQTPDSAANLTGFAPNSWQWTNLTMSNTVASLDIAAGGAYTVNLWLREDGLRVDKVLLITDTNYIPSGEGPPESTRQTVTGTTILQTTVIDFTYDPLYRLTAASYSGDISAGYEYVYDAVGNRTTYTATLTSTVVTTYTYNAANQLITAKEVGSADTWYYAYDDNGNQIRQAPNGLDPANGEVRYSYNQRNLLVQIENHDGSGYLLQAEMAYDGSGNRLQVVSFVGGTAMTTTYTLDSLNNSLPLALDDGAETRTILYGLFGLGEFGAEWRYYLGDGQFSVRQLMDDNGDILLARSYDPFGQVLQETGEGSAIYGFMGAQSGGGGGLLYINGRYFDPTTGRFLSPDNNKFDPWRPGTLNGYLAALLLANPGALLFGPLLVLSRRRKGSKGYYAVLLVVGVGLGITLVSCGTDPRPVPQPPVQSPTLPPVQPPAVGSPTPPPPVSTAPPPVTSTPPPPPPTPAIATATPTPCPTPTHAAPTSTPVSTPTTDRWRITYQELMQYGFDWDRYFLEDSGETEAIVMARFGVGEAAPGNTYDQDLIMWTLRIRKEIGMTRSGEPATIKAVVTNGGAYETLLVLKGETGGNPYTNPQAAAEEGRCGENVIRMTYPCTSTDVNALNRAHVKALGILASDIHNAPSELRYFESFEGAGGTEGTYCWWGDTDTTRLRPSARLAGPGGTVFQDCVLKDNREIWGQE